MEGRVVPPRWKSVARCVRSLVRTRQRTCPSMSGETMGEEDPDVAIILENYASLL
jgi:hypothetical protein